MSNLLEQAKAAASKLADQTEDKGGNFEYTPPAKGPCIGRFVTYVEVGNMPQQPFKGTEKPPAPECIIEFQLLGKKHAKEIEVKNEDGSTTTKTVYPIMRLGRSANGRDGSAVKNGMSMPGGSRSNHYKLLKAMDYGRGNTHMAFMLGEAFRLNIVHNEVEQEVNGKKQTVVYANLKDDNGVWQVSAPLIQKFDEETGDPIGEPQPINAPAATVEPKMLLWDAPTLEQWNSLHIPGTYTTKKGDKEVEVSKNWMQDTVRSALNFEGSAIQNVILSAIDGDLPEMDVDPGSAGVSESVSEGVEADSGAEVPDAAQKTPEGGDIDPLTDLGL